MQKRSKVGQSKLKLRGRTAATSKSTAAYADGAPLDRVQYLEAKLILKPDRFRSVESFREFGKIVKRVARQTELGFIKDDREGLHFRKRRNLWARNGSDRRCRLADSTANQGQSRSAGAGRGRHWRAVVRLAAVSQE
jgi:hypothetical protein